MPRFLQLKEALDPMPSKSFDPQHVAAPYVEDFGTAYVEAYEREPFNLNKADEFGNTLLTICAQVLCPLRSFVH